MNAPDSAAVAPPPHRTVFDLPAWGLGALSLAGFAGSWHWLIDLTSHFRWYYLLAALVWYAVTSRRRSRLATAWLAIAVSVNAWAMLPYWVSFSDETGDGERLSIVSLNLRIDNGDKQRTLAYLRDRKADVVVLLEVNDDWAVAIRDLDGLYPYRVVEPRLENFGLAVLSRLPLDNPRLETPGGGTPTVITGLPRGKNGCLLMAAHPLAPISAGMSARRDAQLAAMGELAGREPRPVIVAGDLNTTPWSHGFRALVEPRGLRDSAIGRGLQATWNARLWAPRIPIDHVVASPEIGVQSRTVGPDLGSDHLPVEASLVVP